MELYVRSKSVTVRDFVDREELLSILEALKSATGFVDVEFTGEGGGQRSLRLLLKNGMVLAASLDGGPAPPERVAEALSSAGSGYVEFDELEDAAVDVQLEFTEDAFKYDNPVYIESIITGARAPRAGEEAKAGEEEAAAAPAAEAIPRTPEGAPKPLESIVRKPADGGSIASAAQAVAQVTVPKEVQEAYPGIARILRDLGIEVDEALVDKVSREIIEENPEFILDTVLIVAQSLAGASQDTVLLETVQLSKVEDIEVLRGVLEAAGRAASKDDTLIVIFESLKPGGPPVVEDYTLLIIRDGRLCAALNSPAPQDAAWIAGTGVVTGVDALKKVDEALLTGREVKVYALKDTGMMLKYIGKYEECKPPKPQKPEEAEEHRERERREKGRRGWFIFRRR